MTKDKFDRLMQVAYLHLEELRLLHELVRQGGSRALRTAEDVNAIKQINYIGGKLNYLWDMANSGEIE